jgi:hypothetical protein
VACGDFHDGSEKGTASVHLLLLLSVRPAESCLIHCSQSRLIVVTPLFGSPVYLQRLFTSDGVRDLYQRKEELWAKNGLSNLA